jgi:hypothetical protein
VGVYEYDGMVAGKWGALRAAFYGVVVLSCAELTQSQIPWQ